jgi:aryl-alcohol dehydrogenase-like predicted oxidoreductase
LNTDFIDLYQLHGPGVPHDDVLALMGDLRSEGKIRGIGVGLESLDCAGMWLESGGVSDIQVPFGVLDPEAGTYVIPRAASLGISVIVRGVFAGGFVARPARADTERLRPGQPEVLAELSTLASECGVDAMQLATWFVSARPGVSTVLIGTSSVRHLASAVRYLGTPAPTPVLERLESMIAQAAADESRDAQEGWH